jgi:phage terminase small subunit
MSEERSIKTKDSLSDKQERFCIEYLLTKGNASKAARLAGYSDSSDNTLSQIGFENLRKPNIIARIDQLREETGVKTGANIEWLTSVLVSAIETALQDNDSKGVALNSSVLMKLMGWDKRPASTIPIEKLADRIAAQWKAMKESTRPPS